MGLMDTYGPPAPKKKNLWDMLADPEQKQALASGLLNMGALMMQNSAGRGYRPGLGEAIGAGLPALTASMDKAAEAKRKREAYQRIATAQSPEDMMLAAQDSPELMAPIAAARMENMFKVPEQTPAQKNWNWINSLPPQEREAAMQAVFPRGDGISVDPQTGEITVHNISEPGFYDPSSIAEKIGVPAQPLDTRGLSGKDASTYARNTRQKAQDILNSPEVTQAATQARTTMGQIDRFNQLQSQQETGGWRGMLPKWAQGLDSQLGEMNSISSKMTPLERVPGSGATSDFDAKTFGQGLPGTDKRPEVNQNIGVFRKKQAEDAITYNQFRQDFFDANGHINGADAAWQNYLNDNPIFDPTSPDELRLNPNRKTYKEYFGETDTPQPGDIVDGYRFKGGDLGDQNNWERVQ